MPTVTFLLGLCGAGKSYLARELEAKTGGKVFEDLLHNKAIPDLLETLKAGRHCIVHEIAFCDERDRDSIVNFLSGRIASLEIKWICFVNDLDSANWNVTYRNDGRDVKALHGYNRTLAKVYT
jgi:hypothetical protein